MELSTPESGTADDFVIGFGYKNDAKRVMDALGARREHFGLTLHPDKTRLLPFRRPPKRQEGGKGAWSRSIAIGSRAT